MRKHREYHDWDHENGEQCMTTWFSNGLGPELLREKLRAAAQTPRMRMNVVWWWGGGVDQNVYCLQCVANGA